MTLAHSWGLEGHSAHHAPQVIIEVWAPKSESAVQALQQSCLHHITLLLCNALTCSPVSSCTYTQWDLYHSTKAILAYDSTTHELLRMQNPQQAMLHAVICTHTQTQAGLANAGRISSACHWTPPSIPSLPLQLLWTSATCRRHSRRVVSRTYCRGILRNTWHLTSDFTCQRFMTLCA